MAREELTRNGTPGGRSAPPAAPPQPRFVDWLDWLPWEKILIWGLFLLAVYTLRSFFMIIFLTFILTYTMRSIVLRISRLVVPWRECVWLERFLTLACFALLLFGLYKAGEYLGPRIKAQAEGLVEKVTPASPMAEVTTKGASSEMNVVGKIIQKTVGAYLFQKTYGRRGDTRYEEGLKKSQQLGLSPREYETFSDLVSSLEKKFNEQQVQRIQESVKQPGQGEKEFQSWFFREKAPAILEKDKESHILRWEQMYRDVAGDESLEEFKKRPDFEQVRNERIFQTIFTEQTKDPQARKDLWQEWEKALDAIVATRLAAFKDSPEYEKRFQEFFESRKAEAEALSESGIPYTYERFLELKKAHRQGQRAFAEAFRQEASMSPEERLLQDRREFEYGEQKKLAEAWRESDLGRLVYGTLDEYGGAWLSSLAAWLRDAVAYLLTLPVQLALSLLLSFFITIDIHRIRGGVLRLRQSRMRDFYDEIAPGLYTFGRLIGRAFQAQGVIAFFNAFLTFLAINYLQIKNEVFLCGIVFVCSFIPVLGVVLSSVPIAVMAIVQPGGTVLLGLQAIGAILVIHFIETSILNPKILGDMLHLHPVMVLAVLAVGEHFFGVWGLLLSVPVTVYILRCVILNEEIPGLIEPHRLAAAVSGTLHTSKAASGKSSFVLETPAAGAEETLPERTPAEETERAEGEGSQHKETVVSSGKVER